MHINNQIILKRVYKTVLLFCGVVFFGEMTAQNVIPSSDTLEMQDTVLLKRENFNAAYPTRVDLVKDSPVVKALDSLAYLKFFSENGLYGTVDFNNGFSFTEGPVPPIIDSIVERRIDEMKRNTPIELTYNQYVKDFVQLYAVRKRGLTSRAMGLSKIYFPIFEEMLDKYHMPLELKYLAVVESALNPTAQSPVGAKGLWQFMYNTGRMYGLKVTSYVDDRSDPYKATDAACRHLKDLYEIYGSWSLVLAAYNSGAGNVNKAIRKAGGNKSYWAVWPYLPKETRGYVPAFIAVAYVMEHAADHNLFPVHPGILYQGIDTVMVKDVLSFDQITELIGIRKDELKFLNPAYKEGVIPATPSTPFTLRLPRNYVADFINNETTLYAFKTQKGIQREKLLEDIKKVKERTLHVVRKGETLARIASHYNVTSQQIVAWNKLKKKAVRKGQKLIIYPGSSSMAEVKPKEEQGKKDSTKTVAAKPETGKKDSSHVASVVSKEIKSEEKVIVTRHKVKPGESLGVIAAKYNISISDLKKANKLKGNSIAAGKYLQIPTEQTSPEHPMAKVNESKNKSQSNDKSIASKQEKKDSEVAVEKGHQTNSSDKTHYYVVKKGDTFYKISKMFEGLTVEDLLRLNDLTLKSTLKIGQKLLVKGSK